MKEMLDLLPRAFRRRGVWVAATLLLRAALNLVGLAMLLPVLMLALDTRAAEQTGPLGRICAAAGFASPRAFALAVCAAVVAVIALKCLACFALSRVERRYIHDLYRTLSRRLLVAYHDRGLPYIKQMNSSVLGRNVNVVTMQFTAGVLKPAATICAEGMMLLLLFGALTLYAPAAALLSAAVFLPAAWGYYALVRRRIDRYGSEENRAQREKARLVAETFRGYAEIEINGAFGRMLRAFDRATDEVIRTRAKEADVGQLPRIVTETGLALGMALLAALSLWRTDGQGQLMFGIFAVAALRLMPSVRNILSGWTTIRYNRHSIRMLHEALADAPDADAAFPVFPADCGPANGDPLPFEREITLRGVGFRYPDGGGELFDRGLDLTIRKGERIGIRGRSGAGKTTLFNLLLGLYRPTAGRIEIDGTPLTPDRCRAWQRRLGYVSQTLFIADGTFAANIALGEADEAIDRQRIAEAVEAAQLGEFIASLPRGIDTPVGECGCRLSGGQRQRIGIARALYRRADVLFFDEATSALDSLTEAEITRSIGRIAAQRPGLTILMIAHRESSLEGCDRIITLER